MMNQRIYLTLASTVLLLTGWSAQAQPATTTAVTQPTTLPSTDTQLPRLRVGRSASINGSTQTAARQGWPLLIEVRGSTTAPSSVEINGADGKPVAWTLQSLPARAGRFTWAVAPDQTQAAPAGNYTAVVRYGKAADSESITVRMTLTAATDALTEAQQGQLPYLMAAYNIRRGDAAAAKQSTDDALKAAPQDVGLLILRGDVLLASAEYSAAISAYTTALDARAALVKEEDDDGPPVLLVAKLREAQRRAGEGKELLNTR